jgi:choline dehydrogenase
MFHPVYNWRFETEPDPGMDGRRIYWPRGRCLGGSSSINGLIYIRGQHEDYDHWACLGNDGWAWKDVAPYFRKLESNSRGASELHGADGPISCSDIPGRHELIDALIEGAGSLGVARNDDFNGERQEGVGYYQLFTRKGWRSSAAVAYLRPARGRANLRVETGAHATRLLFERARATGVEYRQHGRMQVARAAREVLLAAGAIQSPQLLQLSGVGPAALLREYGIPVVADLPGVGENLQDHLQLRLVFKCTKPITTNDDLASWWRSAKIGLQWLLFREGPLAIGINQGGLFTRVLPGSDRPDIQFHIATLSAELAGAKPHPFSGFTLSVCQLRPRSRGTVRIKSADPFQAPAMVPNYLSTAEDRLCAVEAVKFARRLAAAPAVAPYVREEYKPGPGVASDEEILGWCRGNGATIFHPSGTCRMGRDAMAVVDSKLRAIGVEGLRVVDCSVMPTLVSGNTNAPVAMIAERASDLILADAAAGRPA